MDTLTRPAPASPYHLPCRAQHCDGDCPVEPCHRANRTHEAVHLLALGARAGLVHKLTGLEIATTRRLYNNMFGRAAAGGQTPYSGYWYQENEQRLLQTSIVWNIQRRLSNSDRSEARLLIDVFETYAQMVREPLLDINRVDFVPNLTDTKIWYQCTCAACGSVYIAPPQRIKETCPACSMYYRYRCSVCGAKHSPAASGRPRTLCKRCGKSSEKPDVYFLGRGNR